MKKLDHCALMLTLAFGVLLMYHNPQQIAFAMRTSRGNEFALI